MLSRAVAERIVEAVLLQQKQLRELANDVEEDAPEDESKAFIRGIGYVLGAMEIDLLWKIYEIYPDLRPDSAD